MPIAEYADLDGLTAELVKADVSSLELVEEAIRRIAKFNPQLNAVVYKMYDHARKSRKNRYLKPASGVPSFLRI